MQVIEPARSTVCRAGEPAVIVSQAYPVESKIMKLTILAKKANGD